MTKNILQLYLILSSVLSLGQQIQSIQLKPVNSKEQQPFILIGTTIELSFDDLDGNNKELQYKIQQMTHDWKPSKLNPSQYINGFQQNYFTEIENSFNTIENYTHYNLEIPNQNTEITKTGNYLITVLDKDENPLFSRRFVLFKKEVFVRVKTIPSRAVNSANTKQNVQVTVNHKKLTINNPQQELKIAIIQNNNWKTLQINTDPQKIQNSQLEYSYINKNNFAGANEFRYFDNKDIRFSNSRIAKSELKKINNNYLYIDQPRAKLPYTYNPDANGQFVIRNIYSDNPDIEADYAIIHFKLKKQKIFNKDIYIVGQFNNYELTNSNKMYYEKGLYKAKLKLKQGFYNYNYITVEKNKDITNDIDQFSIDGSFYQTDNQYNVLVYYKPIGTEHQQVIGFSKGLVKN